jgi:D-mannonate dehydratase
VRHHLSGLTRQQYDEVSRRLEESGAWPPDGLQMHVCFGSDGNLRVSEIWDSEEQLRAMLDKILPVANDVGVQIAGEPEIFEVHSLETR